MTSLMATCTVKLTVRPAWNGHHRSRIRVHAARTATGAAEHAFSALRLAAMGAATLADDAAVSVIVTWLGAGLDAAAYRLSRRPRSWRTAR
jgi:O-methyltransferase involved in polyketide biosynthesis